MPGEKDRHAIAVFDRARHRAPRAEPWSPAAARSEVLRIIRDFAGARRADGTWPAHPLDNPEVGAPLFSVYFGASGAVSALRILREAGYPAADHSSSLPSLHARYLERPDRGLETGLQMGELGLLTPALIADPADSRLEERALSCIKATCANPAREITSGTTGALHAAATLFARTHRDVWRRAMRDAAEALWTSWQERSGGKWLWRSEVFGSVRHYYGACHGLAGNAEALLRSASELAPGSERVIVERAEQTLRIGALRDGVDINWQVSDDDSGLRRLVQWCHGAPGVVSSLAVGARVDSPAQDRLDGLLEEAGELVWKAGPVAKGSGLCHGSAGNGYAFLALYRRTGDPRWLERARTFAMHAIGQSRRARDRYEQGRYTLWTGDGGLAIYLHHCIHPEQSAFPGIYLM